MQRNLSDIRRSLKMEIAKKHVGKPGFEGLVDDALFNKILKIKNDKFELHSGVALRPFDRHCPLIMELMHAMRTSGIPFNTSKILEECERKLQEDRSFNFASVELPDGTGVAVSSIHPHEAHEEGGRRKRSNRKHKRKSLNRRKRTKRIKKW
jgi:hypothetical protein